jgi:hypothetical protein
MKIGHSERVIMTTGHPSIYLIPGINRTVRTAAMTISEVVANTQKAWER